MIWNDHQDIILSLKKKDKVKTVYITCCLFVRNMLASGLWELEPSVWGHFASVIWLSLWAWFAQSIWKKFCAVPASKLFSTKTWSSVHTMQLGLAGASWRQDLSSGQRRKHQKRPLSLTSLAPFSREDLWTWVKRLVYSCLLCKQQWTSNV